MMATRTGKAVAESDDSVVVDNDHFIPVDAVDRGVLDDSDSSSTCPWEATVHNYSLNVDGKTHPDAGWYHPGPKSAAQEIAGRIAFWRSVEVEAQGVR